MLQNARIISKVDKGDYMEYSARYLESHGIELNPEVTDAVYKNPIIGGLQRIADSFGIYSKFVVGDEGVYFIYGLDAVKMFQTYRREGGFIEFCGSVFPDEYLSKVGAFSRDGFLFRDWNAVKISDHFSMAEIEKLSSRFALMEFFRDRYPLYGLSVPKAICMDSRGITLLLDAKKITDNNSPIDKTKWHALAKQTLLDLAAWEWPIRPTNNQKCGFQAFLASGYAPAGSADKQAAVYQNTDLWEESFYDCESSSARVLLYKKEAAYVKGILMRDNVPFIIESSQSSDLHDYFDEAHAALDGGDPLIKEELIVLPRDVGYVNYLRYKYIGTRFTQEEKRNGVLINPEPEEATEKFVFYLPCGYLDNFRSFTKKNEIIWGYTDLPYYNKTSYFDGVSLVVSLKDMPVIEQYLHKVYDNLYTIHEVTADHLCDKEQRVPAKFTRTKSSGAFIGNPAKGYYVKKSVPRNLESIQMLGCERSVAKQAVTPTRMESVGFVPEHIYSASGHTVCSTEVRDTLAPFKTTNFDKRFEEASENDILTDALLRKNAHKYCENK